MSRWLAQALCDIARSASVSALRAPENTHEPRVPLVPLAPIALSDQTYGTIGTFGTAPESDLDERVAMAEIEGGVPPLYSHAFATLQLTPPPGLPVRRWLQAVNDAGRFLDTFGAEAAAIGWSVDDLFARRGLVFALNGAAVVGLSLATVTLSNGRIVTRP